MPHTPATRTTRSNSTNSTPHDDQGSRSHSIETASKADLNELKQFITQLFKSEFQTLSHKLETLEGRLKSFENSIISIKEEQEKQASEIQELKAGLTCESSRFKNLETLEMISEIEDRLRRRKNVIFTGVEELASGNTSEREAHDEDKVKTIIDELNLSSVSVTQTARIGGKREGGRLLKVTFSDEESRTKLLRYAKSLRTSSNFKRIFINPDRTPKEQMLFRESYQELRQRRAAGEDVVYYRGIVMKRSEISRKQQNFL